jgi:hypothetical protein
MPRYEVSCSFKQHAEDVEGARTDRHRLKRAVFAPPEQFAGGAVEPKPFE